MAENTEKSGEKVGRNGFRNRFLGGCRKYVERVIEKEVYPLSHRVSQVRKSVEQMLNELKEKYGLEGDTIPRLLDSAIEKGLLDSKESKILKYINHIRNAEQHRGVDPPSGADDVCIDALNIMGRMKKRYDLHFQINNCSD